MSVSISTYSFQRTSSREPKKLDTAEIGSAILVSRLPRVRLSTILSSQLLIMADKVYPSMFVNGENTNTEGFKDWVPERDFVGYGFQSPRDCWPNNAKIAVTFALNCESLH